MENKDQIFVEPSDQPETTPRELASYEAGYMVGHYIGYWLCVKHAMLTVTAFTGLWLIIQILTALL